MDGDDPTVEEEEEEEKLRQSAVEVDSSRDFDGSIDDKDKTNKIDGDK